MRTIPALLSCAFKEDGLSVCCAVLRIRKSSLSTKSLWHWHCATGFIDLYGVINSEGSPEVAHGRHRKNRLVTLGTDIYMSVQHTAKTGSQEFKNVKKKSQKISQCGKKKCLTKNLYSKENILVIKTPFSLQLKNFLHKVSFSCKTFFLKHESSYFFKIQFLQCRSQF